jgi:CDP-glycerol glycerophosphotransferase (TagB/SpsB family)
MGFGEICTESEQLVDTLCAYMENGCKMKPEYVARVKDFYEFDDNNNCQRIYEEIMNYQKQVNIDKLK